MEQVAIHEEVGAPKTAMQIAAAKYRRSGKPQQHGQPPAAAVAAEYPEPKRRDEFVHFSVMPSALLPELLCCAALAAAGMPYADVSSHAFG